MFRGLRAPIPCGRGTFDGNINTYNIPINNLVVANNITYEGDCWRKVGGLATFDATGITGSPIILANYDWWPDVTTQRLITAANDGKVYKEVSGDIDSVTLISGLTFTDPVTFVAGGVESVGNDRKLFMYSKGVVPKYLAADGATMSTISNPSVDWTGANQPSGALAHDNRIAVFGNANQPHLVYFSTLSDHGDFVTNNPPIVEVFPGEGQYISNCISMLPTTMFVFKYPRGIYRFDSSAITSYFIPVTKVRDDVGCAGPLASTRVDDDYWFISATGHIYSLYAVNTVESLKQADITAKLNLELWTKDNVDLTRIKFSRIHYDTRRKEVWVVYTSKTSTRNDIILRIDVSRPGDPRAAVDNRGAYFESVFSRLETDQLPQVYVGGQAGLVYKANQENRTIGTSLGYLGDFQTPDTDFGYVSPGLASLDKRFYWLEIISNPTGNYNLSIDTYIDGDKYDSYTINLGSSGSQLDGSFTLGDPNNPQASDFVLGGLSPVSHKIRIGGQGQRLGIRGYNNTPNQDFSINNMIVHFEPVNEPGQK